MIHGIAEGQVRNHGVELLVEVKSYDPSPKTDSYTAADVGEEKMVCRESRQDARLLISMYESYNVTTAIHIPSCTAIAAAGGGGAVDCC